MNIILKRVAYSNVGDNIFCPLTLISQKYVNMYLINQLVYMFQSPTLKILIKFIYQEYLN